ncbi:MAG: EbsC protein [Bacillota bacterium]|nr:MAG: EbsC protein [Bacillota bacterium]
MSIDKVREYLGKFGLSERVRVFDVSSATVELAAAALSVEPARIAKTMTFLLKSGPVAVVAAGDRKIDNAKFKARFGEKAKMIPAESVEEIVGHPVGGVCPFALNEGVAVFLDEGLKRFGTVFPACGSANSAAELTPEELRRCTGGAWVDVCKPSL